MPGNEPEDFVFNCGTCGPNPIGWESEDGKQS